MKKKILVIDDTQENIELMLELLSDRYDVMVALDGQHGLEIAQEEEPSLILLDIMMPVINGYEVCKHLKNNPKTESIPVIFLTAKVDEDSIEQAYEVGGADYVSKPFKPRELFARVAKELKVQELISRLKESQQKLELLSSVDYLTSLYNRRYFLKRAEPILELSKRHNTDLCVIMIDIDDFKKINDKYGHKLGDEVLVSFSNLMQELSRKSDIVCRWGGEEFVILFPHTNLEGAQTIAKKLQKRLKELFIVVENDNVIQFTVSIGLSIVLSDDKSVEESLLRADSALYRAKKNGKDRISIF
ncbi:diguanylate cyclase [Sulfurimonas sp. SAG-AH-194-L11]|nr:diguanylate cyclase [Sulfurimonas sp. SAG-AH-194-L11]MDF1877577.1 diguanylate cyclase [Sulfurimonas sp. SAG-AH-194-L11]